MICHLSILLTAAFLFVGQPAMAAPPSQPTGLRVNDVVNPVGTGAAVGFGWQVHDPDPDEIQTACQILVASSLEKLTADQGDIRDSGRIEGRLQNHVAIGGDALKDDHRYFWKVRTWDKDGNPGPWSRPATFDTGLLTNSGWQGASWIRRDSQDKDDHSRFRKSAVLPDKPIERAIACISATHRFELRVNGSLVGKGPAYQYPDRQYYHAYNITPLLKAGVPNLFAVRTHWFGGGQGRPAGERGMIMKVIVHHTDGSVTTIGTDGSWHQSRANAWVLDSLVPRNGGEGVGYVERIDGRLLEPGWDAPGFDDSSWQPVQVVGPHPVEPWTGTLAPDLTRIVETVVSPASITDRGKGKYVIDLGKVRTGMPRIRFSGGKGGDAVAMRGGYELNADGEIPPGTKSQSTNMEYPAILSGGDFICEPVEYLGMRYFQIDNAPMPVTPENFSFVARHSAMDDAASSFDSPDATLNAVWGLMKHSLFTCAQEEFVDTPTREKGGFLGDGAIQSSAAMAVLNERPLTRRVLGEFLDSMDRFWSKPADRGRMNAVYPNKDGGRDIPDFTQAYLPWVWNYYMETGDREFLAANWEHFSEIGGYLDRHINPETGLVTRLTGGSGAYRLGIIDWPPTMRYGYDMNTTARTVINGWAVADYDTLAKIAGVLGRTPDETANREKSAKLRESINSRLINGAGIYVDGLTSSGAASGHASQHANLFPLALGMVPREHLAAVTDHVKAQGMNVGMVTVGWLVRALGEANEGPALIDLLTNPDQPGWARCLALGATATWESWDSDKTGNSLSHAWGAAGLEGYVRYIMGIRPTRPQYEQVRIQPLDFGDRLEWAKGGITTDRGPIEVHWKRTQGNYGIRLKIPVNVTAEVVLPKGPANNPRVELDGREVKAEDVGNTLVVRGVGSGEHAITRLDPPGDLK